MKHELHTITEAEALEVYVLRVKFGDGLERTVDLNEVLYGELCGPLRDEAVFASVAVDPEVRTVVWPNGADFDPATLHDWPDHEAAWKAQARRWRMAAV